MKEEICDLLGISLKSYYNWKKSRKIISFLEEYFDNNEIQEYMLTKKMTKLELIKNYSIEELKVKLNTKHVDPVHGTEDYLIVNIRYKISNHIKKSILQDVLKKVLSENNLIDTTNDINSKDLLIKAIKNFQTSIKRSEFEDKKNDTLQFITNYLISNEVFLIIKYPEVFLEE